MRCRSIRNIAERNFGASHVTQPTEATLLTFTEVQAAAAQELRGPEAVVVPHRQLQRALGQLLQACIFEHQRVVPRRVQRFAAHARLLLGGFPLLGKQKPGRGERR